MSGRGAGGVGSGVKGRKRVSRTVRQARSQATRPKSGSKSKGKSKTRGKSSKDSY